METNKKDMVYNIGVGGIDRDNKILVYSISKPDGMEMSEEFNDKQTSVPKIEDFIEYDPKALINDEKFYIDLDNLKENSVFRHIKNAFCVSTDLENLISDAEQIGLRKKDFKDLNSRELKLKFLILEKNDTFLFLYLNPYSKILKNKKGINLGKKPTKLSIQYAIVYPDYVSAFLDKKSKKLYIINPMDFEKMFNLKVVRLEKAKNILQKFKNEEYTIGNTEIVVKFGEAVDLETKAYFKTRQINYLSNYNPDDAPFKTSRIVEAVNSLDQKYRFDINEQSKSIFIENEHQFKTFVGILHDSIIQRILSGKYEV